MPKHLGALKTGNHLRDAQGKGGAVLIGVSKLSNAGINFFEPMVDTGIEQLQKIRTITFGGHDKLL